MTSWLVTIVHGDLETEADAAAVRSVNDKAWELGARVYRGSNDTGTYVMPTHIGALALLAHTDAVARSWWRTTIKEQP